MGNIFPRIINLKNNFSLVSQTIALIEKSFNYSKKNSFAIDFAPLMSEKNYEHCYVLIDENENVIGHVGALVKTITIEKQIFSVVMLGGIAIDENQRGKGYFHQLFQHALSEFKNDCSFFLLWGNEKKLYEKYGFYYCGPQYQNEVSSSQNPFERKKISDLSESEFIEIKNLYEEKFKTNHITFNRTNEEWESLKKIISADLFVKKENTKIVDYFVKNKGEDLTNIIYEYSSQNIGGDGIIWKAQKNQENDVEQFQFMLCPGDLKQFSDFLAAYTKNQIIVKHINPMKKEIFFEFQNEILSLPIDEFLFGVIGPGYFEDLEGLKPIFISGLDSI